MPRASAVGTHAGLNMKGYDMKSFFSVMFYKWLVINVSVISSFAVLDYIFNRSTSISFFESGFLAFVILWCAKQDKIKKEGK